MTDVGLYPADKGKASSLLVQIKNNCLFVGMSPVFVKAYLQPQQKARLREKPLC